MGASMSSQILPMDRMTHPDASHSLCSQMLFDASVAWCAVVGTQPSAYKAICMELTSPDSAANIALASCWPDRVYKCFTCPMAPS